MLSEQQIKSIRDVIVRKYNPEAIYVFGSYATGKASKESDLDLLVINSSELENDKVGIEISKSLFPRDYSLDLFVLRAEEFQKKIDGGLSFWKNIHRCGKKIYER